MILVTATDAEEFKGMHAMAFPLGGWVCHYPPVLDFPSVSFASSAVQMLFVILKLEVLLQRRLQLARLAEGFLQDAPVEVVEAVGVDPVA